MLPVVLAAAMMHPVQLRPDIPPLVPADISAMDADTLAALILAPGHPPVVRVRVGPPQSMLPPPPPRAMVATPISFTFKARPNRSRTHCERQVAVVTLAPASQRGPNGVGDVAASRPERLSLHREYRWVSRVGRSCADAQPFFDPRPIDADRAFRVIKDVASLQRAVRAGRPLPVPVTIDDRYSHQVREVAKLLPDRIEPVETLTSGAAALVALPLDAIERFGTGGFDLLGLRGSEALARNEALVTFFSGGLWQATLLLKNKRIARMPLRRAIPAPF